MKSIGIGILFMLALFAGTSRAQNQVSRHVVASGGVAQGANFHVYSAIGQPVAARSAGAANQVCSGFECIVSGLLGGTFNAVAVSFFDARLEGREVTLTWEILAADGLTGFNIYRSSSPAGGFVKLNDTLLRPETAGAYVDARVEPGRTYSYRLGAIDRDGEFLSQVQTVTTPVWPTELKQNYPNPFNPATTIAFYLARPGNVSLWVYNAQGRRVATLLGGLLAAGDHKVDWNGTNDAGERVGSGVYFYRLLADGRAYTRKLTLLK